MTHYLRRQLWRKYKNKKYYMLLLGIFNVLLVLVMTGSRPMFDGERSINPRGAIVSALAYYLWVFMWLFYLLLKNTTRKERLLLFMLQIGGFTWYLWVNNLQLSSFFLLLWLGIALIYTRLLLGK